jgi:hypothetical protein
MALLSAVSGNPSYVSDHLFQNAHLMGVLEKVERAQRILGDP